MDPSPIGSPMLRARASWFSISPTRPGSTSRLMHKDIELALDAAPSA